MHEAYRTDGVVTESGGIEAHDLPFDKGQRVELVIWPTSELREESSQEEIARRLAGFNDLVRWLQETRPKGLPVLSDEAMSRESIYEDRGL